MQLRLYSSLDPALYLFDQVDDSGIEVGELVRALLCQRVFHRPHDVAAGTQHAQLGRN